MKAEAMIAELPESLAGYIISGSDTWVAMFQFRRLES
jgi:hypothetical protein